MLPSSDSNAELARTLCYDGSLLQGACSTLLFQLAGDSPRQLNRTMLPVILSHIPAGASTKQVLHYGQLIDSGRFRQFDYGAKENLLRYGTVEPTDYDLSRIRAPVALSYADNDYVSAPEDVLRLRQALPNVVALNHVADPTFNHVDYIWGVEAPQLVYDHVMLVMRIFERRSVNVNIVKKIA